MRQTYILLVALVLASTTCAYSQLDTNGLIAHWAFNGNINDVTGRGHNASLFYYHTGTPPQVYRPGINGNPGSSFQFRSDVQMQAQYQPDLNLDSFSIAAVVNFDTLSSYATLLYRVSMYGITSLASYAAVMVNPANSPNYCFMPESEPTIPYHSYQDLLYYPSAKDSTWYYLVVTYDGDTFKTYVNGSLKSTYISTRPFQDTASTAMYIGGYFDLHYLQFTAPFMGIMDDLRLYNRALAYDEIVTYPFNFYDTTVALNMSVADSVKCAGTGLNVKYLVSENFRNTNVFTVQMSDTNGSFASPIQIGRDSTNISGTIPCTIPVNTPTGWYAIRLISSAPADTTYEYYFNYHPQKNTSATAVFYYRESVSYYPPTNGICKGDTMALRTENMTGLGVTPATYQWQKNGVNIPSATMATYGTRTAAHNDTFRCIMTSTHACWAGDTVVSTPYIAGVDTIPSITANISVAPDDSICINDTATFYISNINIGTANAVGWHIKNRPGISFPAADDTLITRYVHSFDTFFCSFVSHVTCAPMGRLSSDYIVMFVDSNTALPKVSVTAQPGNIVPQGTHITFTANATDTGIHPGYQWLKNNVPIPGATRKTYIALYPSLSSSDRISVIVKNTTNKCLSVDSVMSSAVTVYFTNSVYSISFNPFSVYPNPSNGHFTLEASKNITTPVTISIADVTGRVVYSELREPTGNQLIMNVHLPNNIPAGAYILKLTATGETQYTRLLIGK